MIFYGGYGKYGKNLGSNNKLIMINLDTGVFETKNTILNNSFWHGTNIWNDNLIILQGGYRTNFNKNEILTIYNLNTENIKKFEMKFQSIEFGYNSSSFILDDILYFTTKQGYICTFDLEKKVFTKIDKQFPFIIRGTTMNYHNGYIYTFGGENEISSYKFYKIEMNSFQYEEIMVSIDIYIRPRYGHSAHIYNNELIIFGGFDGISSFGDVIHLSLEGQFKMKLYQVLKQMKHNISFNFY